MSSLLARRLLTLHKLEPGLIDFTCFHRLHLDPRGDFSLELADERDDISSVRPSMRRCSSGASWWCSSRSCFIFSTICFREFISRWWLKSAWSAYKYSSSMSLVLFLGASPYRYQELVHTWGVAQSWPEAGYWSHLRYHHSWLCSRLSCPSSWSIGAASGLNIAINSSISLRVLSRESIFCAIFCMRVGHHELWFARSYSRVYGVFLCRKEGLVAWFFFGNCVIGVTGMRVVTLCAVSWRMTRAFLDIHPIVTRPFPITSDLLPHFIGEWLRRWEIWCERNSWIYNNIILYIVNL